MLAVVPTGCAARPNRPAASTGPVTGTVTVLAAASLTGAFTRIGKDFEAAHPGARVTFSFGGSSGLAQQITQGAPADVFAAASTTTMKQVSDAGLTPTGPVVFARNQLVIAVAKGDPKGVRGLADLARPGITVALCAPAVPCGDAARRALSAAGVRVVPVTQEEDVKAALTKVRLGEVDAALVYRTDVRDAGDAVTGVEFPESAQAVNDYPIAVLADAPNPAGASAFVDYVRSPAGQAVLSAAGFQPP
ncbi:MAG TPA: molybdate ABC transporter substrate-binding protein [Micromonosporaceae bacterium]